MSKIAKTLVNLTKAHTKILIAALSVTGLLLVYGLGMIVLPMTILYSYQNKNCDIVFSLNSGYTNLYPGFIQDETILRPVSECSAYTSATSHKGAGNWQVAYDSYQAYSNTYPNGLYVAEAHEQSAVVLMSLTKDQIEQKQYDQALVNLNLIVSDHSDTGMSAEAWTLFPSAYTSWGTGLRKSADFERAEQVFNEFKTWSQNNQKAELEADAQSELTQTYLAWGRALQSQKQFEGALSKLDLAEVASQKSQTDSMSELMAGQRSIYIEWGNDLLEQGKFSVAIEKFGIAVSKSDSNEDGAKDALANGYIKWASKLSADEDFLADLEQLEFAKETASSEAIKQSVETTFGETYLAFSNSTGTQARVAMKEALATVCQKHKKPTLPIFGLNKDLIRVGLSGVDAQLPENLVPRTPGELHYIACIEEEKHTVSTRDRMALVLRTPHRNYYKWIMQFRVQLLWNINLQKTETAESVAEKSFTGKMPPPFPDTVEVAYISGPPPTIEELTGWLESVIR